MKEIYRYLLDHIPDYSEFLTVEELDASSRSIAAKYPEVASTFEIGRTKEGRPIVCLKIEGGAKNALMFGCPHPNEPIGTMMLEYFSEQLAQNKSLRDELGYTWYIVKAWDADGLKKNERWLKGPYNIYNYSRYFFRPAGHQQVDWTFPVDHKELHFHDSIPETRAMMKLIDEIEPHFIYSLHNAGFGGVYWYISDELAPLYDSMRAAADRVGVPLNLGEPETPWCEALSPAVYRALGIEQNYDYLEKYGATNIPDKINAGNCSESYARRRHGSFTLLTELPYFYDKRIMDGAPSGKTRRECTLSSLDRQDEHDRRVRGYLKRIEPIVDPKNQYRLALEAFTRERGQESIRKMAETDPDYARIATVAEEFDSTVLTRFYRLLSLGMVIGMCEFALEHQGASLTPDQKAELGRVRDEAEQIHLEETKRVEAALDYEVVPIRKLVSIQLECGLLVADHLRDKPPLPRQPESRPPETRPVDPKLRRFLEMSTERSPVWIDDENIAYIRRDENGNHIWKLDLKTRKRTRLTQKEVRIWKITCHAESGDIYFAADDTGSECEQIFRMRPGQPPENLTATAGVRHFFGGVSADGAHIGYACNKRQSQTFDIWKLDASTGKATLMHEFDDHYNWPCDDAMSPDGRFMLYNKLKGESDNALWITDLHSGESHRVPRDERISAETQPAWLHDGSGFYLLSDRDSDFINVWFYDLKSQTMKLVYEYGWDAERMSLSADDRYLAVLVNEGGYMRLHLYDRSSNSELETIQPPRGVLSYYQQLSWSPHGHRLLFTVDSGRRPEGIWLLDLDAERMERITDKALTPEDEALLVEPVLGSYRSFDGLEVPYWLYVPAGAEPKNLPILIEIHGGPEGQEMPSFNDFIQYLVSEGIAVVAPNVRGSSGYGKIYTHLDDVEKRLDSVRDIESLVAHLVETGIADPARLGVSGTSYGGFMTLSCAARYPHLWACAVDTVGMYNLVTFLENTADYRRPHRESEYGTLAHHRELLEQVSPVAKIRDITAPMMIIQGRNDPRVPVTEADQAVAALRSLGRTVEYLCYDDEGHGIAKLKNRLDCYPQVAAFIKKHLSIH